MCVNSKTPRVKIHLRIFVSFDVSGDFLIHLFVFLSIFPFVPSQFVEFIFFQFHDFSTMVCGTRHKICVTFSSMVCGTKYTTAPRLNPGCVQQAQEESLTLFSHDLWHWDGHDHNQFHESLMMSMICELEREKVAIAPLVVAPGPQQSAQADHLHTFHHWVLPPSTPHRRRHWQCCRPYLGQAISNAVELISAKS